MNGLVKDMPEIAYHRHQALSSTGARMILDSPALFHHRQQHPRPDTAAFDLGTATHTKVLGVGSRLITWPDEHLTPSGAVSTKAATVAWEKEQRAKGKVLVTPEQHRISDAMTEAVLAHPIARHLLEQVGDPEVSMFATDPDTGVELRARFDYLAPTAVDLKTTSGKASADGFTRSVATYGYDVQEAHYRYVRRLVEGEPGPFRFIVAETKAPYLVGVHELSDDWRDIANAKARRAREVFAECIATDTWPGYALDGPELTPPMWLVREYEDLYEPQMVV